MNRYYPKLLVATLLMSLGVMLCWSGCSVKEKTRVTEEADAGPEVLESDGVRRLCFNFARLADEHKPTPKSSRVWDSVAYYHNLAIESYRGRGDKISEVYLMD